MSTLPIDRDPNIAMILVLFLGISYDFCRLSVSRAQALLNGFLSPRYDRLQLRLFS